jgi:hypothetical protein
MVGPILHVVPHRGFFFVFYEGRRIFCHVSRWSELKLPAVGDIVSFEIGPGRKPQYPFEGIAVRPATKEESDTWNAQVDALLASHAGTNALAGGV